TLILIPVVYFFWKRATPRDVFAAGVPRTPQERREEESIHEDD
mgnify:CR=1